MAFLVANGAVLFDTVSVSSFNGDTIHGYGFGYYQVRGIVELSNYATYDNSNMLEKQNIISWSNELISITIEAGDLFSDTILNINSINNDDTVIISDNESNIYGNDFMFGDAIVEASSGYIYNNAIMYEQTIKSVLNSNILFYNDNLLRLLNPSVYIIGDSTAASYDYSRYPLSGWASVLDVYFDSSKMQIFNKAISGTSSKSFYDLGYFDNFKHNIKPGDFIIIQFGHNDMKSWDETRYTVPYGTYNDYLSIYIDYALSVNAIPILTTSVNRNYWDGNNIVNTLGDYPDSMLQLAATRNIDFVDMTQLTKDHFELIGENIVTFEYFLNLEPGVWENYPNGYVDNSHFQYNGAIEVAKLFSENAPEYMRSFLNG